MTNKEFAKTDSFRNAVKKALTKIGKLPHPTLPDYHLINDYTTKRQASKYRMGRGWIYNSLHFLERRYS